MALPLIPIVSILSSIAPTIAQGLLMKGTIGEKAMHILKKFADKLGLPDNEDLAYALKKLELEQVLELKRLDVEFKLEMERFKFDIDKLVITEQSKIIQADSRSLSLVRRWWRPFIAWTLGITLFMFYGADIILYQIFRFCVMFGWLDQAAFDVWRSAPPLLDMPTIIGLIVPLLGLGAYRTFEKYSGTDDK